MTALLGGNLALGLGSAAATFISDFLGRRSRRDASRQQRRLLEEARQGVRGQGPLADILGPSDPSRLREQFDAGIREPALRRFREETIPSIFQQFNKGNLADSSFFGDAIGRATRDFEEGQESLFARLLLQDQTSARGRASNFVSQLLGIPDQEDPSLFATPLGKIGQAGFGTLLNRLDRPEAPDNLTNEDNSRAQP